MLPEYFQDSYAKGKKIVVEVICDDEESDDEMESTLAIFIESEDARRPYYQAGNYL